MSKKLSKLLIVDDDEDILTVSKISVMSMPDLGVQGASSGEEAVVMALEFNPDLILLDLMMPNMDGISTLKAVRLIPSIAKIPIVFFTAFPQSKDLEEFFKQGVIGVIVKPFDPMNLPTLIEEIWDKYQKQSES